MKTSQELFAKFQRIQLSTLLEGTVLEQSPCCIETDTRLSRRRYEWEEKLSQKIEQQMKQPCAVIRGTVQKENWFEVGYSVLLETKVETVTRFHFNIEINGTFCPVWSYYTQNLDWGSHSHSLEDQNEINKLTSALETLKECLSEHPSYRLHMLTQHVTIENQHETRLR